MRSGERQSPIRTALACGVLGVTALAGGNIIDQYDGLEESAPADIAKFGGSLLALYGLLKGAGTYATTAIIEGKQEELQEKQRLLDGLPKMRDGFDPVHIVSRLAALESGRYTIDGIQPLAVSERLFRTHLAVHNAPPYPDIVLKFFHQDVREVVGELADSKNGIGPIPGGYIWDRGDEVFVMPNKVVQFARFLDDAAPLNPTANEQPDWYSWISAQVADIKWARLLDGVQRS